MTDTEATLRAERRGRVGRIIMNRPRALNALDHDMILAMHRALDAWRDDPHVHAITIEGCGGRAFCAGGDIREGRRMAMEGNAAAIETFFRDEYALNEAIATCPKPFVALVDGICMGGGLGVSIHGAYRVATEHAVFAMPETAIGLFPDIGASFFLPRLPGAIGMWMGLTGARITGAEAVHAGIATHFVPHERLGALADALAADGAGVLGAFAAPLPPSELPGLRPAIDRCFGGGSLDDIRAALTAADSAWARDQLATLDAMSPSSLRWTFALLHAGAGRTLRAALDAELVLTRSVMFHPDFVEGVRAMVVDKDRKPRWVTPEHEATQRIMAGFAA